MFQLTLLDHLRMTFEGIATQHRTHLKAAYDRARWSRWLQAAEALLLAAVFFTSLDVAIGNRRELAVAGAVLAAVALTLLLIRLTFDFDASSRANASWAARLWLVRERYQSVLSDLAEGAIDVDTARVRRDSLMSEIAVLYQDASAHGIAHGVDLRGHAGAPPADQQTKPPATYGSAAPATSGAAARTTAA